MNDFLNIYNPNNAFQLTPEQIAAMSTLTDDEIKELAIKYPNTGHGGAYLVLQDANAQTQIYPTSTWQNLYNLRVKNGKKNYVAFTFKSLFVKNRSNNNIPVSTKVQDLTQNEIDTAPGIKKVKAGIIPVLSDNINTDEEFPDLTAEVPVRNKSGRKPTNK